MIVIEYKPTVIIIISLAAYSQVAGAQITVGDVTWYFSAEVRQSLSIPWTILTVRRNDHPFFTQWMPTFFPGHKNISVFRNLHLTLSRSNNRKHTLFCRRTNRHIN